MAPRCIHRAALVASLTAVSMRIARSGSISSASGTRSTPLVPGMRMSHSINAILWRRSSLSASSPDAAAYVSKRSFARNFLSALRIGSSSSTTNTAGRAVESVKWRTPCRLWQRWRAWRCRASRSGGSADELEVDEGRKQAGAGTALEQLGHRAPAGGAVVDGKAVHIHPYELIGLSGVQPAAELARVREGLRPVRQRVFDTGLQVP